MDRLIDDDAKKGKDPLQEYYRQIYYDKDKNTSSIERLYRQAKDSTKDKELKKLVTLKSARAFIEKQGAYQRTKTFKKPKEFRSVIAPRVGSNLQADLMFFKFPYKVKALGKDGNVLNVVDIHSRRAWSIPNKNKEAPTILAGLKKIVEQVNREQGKIQSIKGNVVQSLNSDNGTEFKNKEMAKFLEDNGIDHYMNNVDDFAKNAIVERFNRTLRRLMIVDKEQNENKQFEVDDIARYVKNYNNDVHSTIKAKPMEVYDGNAKNQQVYKFGKFKFKKGDIVRTLNKKALFAKGKYEYSRELYEIIDNDNNGNKYKLKNIDNGNVLQKQYQGYELQLIDSAEEKDGYDIVKAEKNISDERAEKERDELDTKLNKEIGADLRVDKQAALEDDVIEIEKPPLIDLKPKDKIKVFWSDKGVMWEKRHKFNKKTKGKFYPATILKIIAKDDPEKIMYFVQFPEDPPPNKYKLNLTRKAKADFVEQGKGWRKA